MDDKHYRHERGRIRKLKKKWFSDLGLGWWSVDIFYYRERKSAGERTVYAPRNMNGVWECAMDTTCDPYYLTGSIGVYLPVCQNLSDTELELTFVHECMHILLSSMRQVKTSPHEELVATQLAKAFLWVAEARQKQTARKTRL